VLGGLIAFPFTDAHKVFDVFRKATTELPDELTVFFGLVHAPDGSGQKLTALAVCHSGELAKAENDVKPLLSISSPLLNAIEPMPYPVVNTLLDDGYPKGARNYWKSAFLKELSDESVQAMIDAFAVAPSNMNSVLVEHYHGQATRVRATETAFPHRDPGYNLGVFAEWLDPADDTRNREWTREAFAALAPFVGDATYVNYLDDDDNARVRTSYGPNWPRLVELKRRYDPRNVFHVNQNIDPTVDGDDDSGRSS
jgi:FAD/FMN-containing dehydrogenase